jgi:hypothetical protein
MKNLIFILLSVSLCSATTSVTLDSIYKESKVGEQKAKHMGWLPRKNVTTISATTKIPIVKGAVDTAVEKKVKSVEFIPEKKVTPVLEAPILKNDKFSFEINNQDTLISRLTQKVSDLESNQEKITLIMASLQSASNTHSDNQDFIIRMVEIIMGSIATLLAAYITAKATKKI